MPRIRNPSVSQIEIWAGGQIPVWVNKYLENQVIGLQRCKFKADCFPDLAYSSDLIKICKLILEDFELRNNWLQTLFQIKKKFSIKCCKPAPEAEQAICYQTNFLFLISNPRLKRRILQTHSGSRTSRPSCGASLSSPDEQCCSPDEPLKTSGSWRLPLNL